jgi:hypothetical protein
MKKLERKEMKKCKGGFGPPKTLWRCLTDPFTPWYDNVCYSVQPQGPCGYTQPCTAIGSCNANRDLCIH